MAKDIMPDFEQLVTDYQHKLTNGQRAELRRVEEPDRLLDMPVFYRLIQGCGLKPNSQAGRLVYFLPYASHKNEADSLGLLMQQKEISEKRLFQAIRAESPDDLLYLRRIMQQMKPTVDWKDFGRMLYFWGKNSKRQLLRDYCLKSQKITKANRITQQGLL